MMRNVDDDLMFKYLFEIVCATDRCAISHRWLIDVCCGFEIINKQRNSFLCDVMNTKLRRNYSGWLWNVDKKKRSKAMKVQGFLTLIWRIWMRLRCLADPLLDFFWLKLAELLRWIRLQGNLTKEDLRNWKKLLHQTFYLRRLRDCEAFDFTNLCS
jgi:hypothetical protein